MAEATTTETTTQPAEVTLDDVYREFNVAPEAEKPTTATPEPLKAPAAPSVDLPDFYDVEKVKAWAAQQQNQVSVLQSQVQQFTGVVTQAQRAAQQATLERDISHAVETINETVQLPDNQKKLIEYALEDKARSDPRFKQLWDNRGKNPIAWSKALTAVRRDIAETFAVKADPQIAANRRALRDSQASSATTQTGGEEPSWMSQPSDSAEFQKGWNRMLSGT